MPLPPLDDPKDIAARSDKRAAAKVAAVGQTKGAAVGQVIDAASEIDPNSLSDQIARSILRRHGIDIPTPDEARLASMDMQRRLFDAKQADAVRRVIAIRSSLADPETQRALGYEGRIDADTLLETDPDLFGMLGQKLGILPKDVAPASYLALAGAKATTTASVLRAAQAEAQAGARDAANKKLADTAAAVQHEKVKDAAIQEAAGGEGNLGERVKQANPDLPSYTVLGPEEARVARQKFNSLMEQLDSPELRGIVAEAYLTKYAAQFKDNFEESPVTDEQGNAIVGPGTGTYFVKGDAKGELGALLVDINKYLPGAENDQAPGGTALRAIGLGDKYAGINAESLAPYFPKADGGAP